MGRIIKKFKKEYECKFSWDDDCGLQYGENGLVLRKDGSSYTTAFLEAFPNNPDTFIRGEGKTVEEAEKDAWEQLQKYKNCKEHEFERRGYTNGVGFCKHCGLFKSRAFEPLTKCFICGKPTDYTSDKNGNFYCKEHCNLISWDDLNIGMVEHYLMKAQTNIKSYEDLEKLIERENKYGLDDHSLYLKGIKIVMDKYMGKKEYVFGYGSRFRLYTIKVNSDILSADIINVDDTELYLIELYDRKNKINRLILNDSRKYFDSIKSKIK